MSCTIEIRNGRELLWCFGESADYPDPHSFSLPLLYRQGWYNERYTSLLDQASRTMEQAKRLNLYRQADRIVVEDAIILPVCHPTEHLLVKPWVRRFRNEWRSWHEVVIEPH